MITYRIDILRVAHERGGDDPNDWHELPRVYTISELPSALNALYSPGVLHDSSAIRIRRKDE